MKSSLAFFTDSVFILLTTFILSVVVLNYFTPYPYSLIFSVCVAVFVTTIYVKVSSSKRSILKLSREEKKLCEKVVLELNFSSRAQQVSLIEKAINKKGFDTERKNGGVLVKSANAVIFMKFGFTKPTKADVVKAFNSITKKQKAYIVAETFDQDTVEFAKRFDQRVQTVNGVEIYSFLKETDTLPQFIYSNYEQPKRANLKNLLDKKQAKSFFFFGLTFLFMSYFAPIKLYYVLFGCSFMIFSIILRFFGKDSSNKDIEQSKCIKQ